jgi:hypothetical protein
VHSKVELRSTKIFFSLPKNVSAAPLFCYLGEKVWEKKK